MTKARDLANAGTALSAVSATELGYVDGVTSAIQTQIDGKQAINANVSTTELGYLDGVTSAIQTQIDSKIGSASAINPTIVDAKGDIIAATAADTVARLAVGANGTVLTAASGQATGLQWATPSSGGMTLLSTTTLSGASTTISSIDQTYKNLEIVVFGVTNATADGILRCAPNGTTNITSQNWFADYGGSWSTNTSFANNTYLYLSGNNNMTRTDTANSFAISIFNYSSTTSGKPHRTCGQYMADGAANRPVFWTGGINTTTAISSLVFTNTGGNFSTGTVLIYGVK